MQQSRVLVTGVVMVAILVMDFQQVVREKVQFTVGAFAVLVLQELGFEGCKSRTVSQSVAPVEPVSIIRRTIGFDLDMAANWRFRVSSKFESFASLKHPATALIDQPIARDNLMTVQVRVTVLCPAQKLSKQVGRHCRKYGFANHRGVKRNPTPLRQG